MTPVILLVNVLSTCTYSQTHRRTDPVAQVLQQTMTSMKSYEAGSWHFVEVCQFSSRQLVVQERTVDLNETVLEGTYTRHFKSEQQIIIEACLLSRYSASEAVADAWTDIY